MMMDEELRVLSDGSAAREAGRMAIGDKPPPIMRRPTESRQGS